MHLVNHSRIGFLLDTGEEMEEMEERDEEEEEEERKREKSNFDRNGKRKKE